MLFEICSTKVLSLICLYIVSTTVLKNIIVHCSPIFFSSGHYFWGRKSGSPRQIQSEDFFLKHCFLGTKIKTCTLVQECLKFRKGPKVCRRPAKVKNHCINRFEGMKSVVTTYQVLEPSFLSSVSHLDIKIEAKNVFDKFADNVSLLFSSQMLSIKTSFKDKIVHLKSAKEMTSFLIVKNVSLATTYPDVCTAYRMYLQCLSQ